jgi:hypothetical protein
MHCFNCDNDSYYFTSHEKSTQSQFGINCTIIILAVYLMFVTRYFMDSNYGLFVKKCVRVYSAINKDNTKSSIRHLYYDHGIVEQYFLVNFFGIGQKHPWTVLKNKVQTIPKLVCTALYFEWTGRIRCIHKPMTFSFRSGATKSICMTCFKKEEYLRTLHRLRHASIYYLYCKISICAGIVHFIFCRMRRIPPLGFRSTEWIGNR